MVAVTQADGYKFFHKTAFHSEIQYVYENYTNRFGKYSNIPDCDGVVVVGTQYFAIAYLINDWDDTFFDVDKECAIKNLKRRLKNYFGFDYNTEHFEALHDLGYLPIKIKSLPEGTVAPYGVPTFTITNTVRGYAWLVGFLETVCSSYIWKMQTNATTALAYKRNIAKAFEETGVAPDLLPFMCHDFSFRGLTAPEAGATGFAWLTSFAGTDTLPAIDFAEDYYNADSDKELVGASVPATEHAVATSYINIIEQQKGVSKFEAELEFVEMLLEKVPKGIVSHVSDSYDFWKVVSEGLPLLKDKIMSREGKLVIRPDSGDPVDILCGTVGSWNNLNPEVKTPEQKGLIEVLWDIFGGTTTEKGYKLLDEHIGAIYGDSITLDRQQEIISRLKDKGFAPVVVLGVGSYSLNYVTRDTHGSAIKATSCVLSDGSRVDFAKDPKTDSSKKSLHGLIRVDRDEDGNIVVFDNQTEEQEQGGLLETVFENGVLVKETSLLDIRELVDSQL